MNNCGRACLPHFFNISTREIAMFEQLHSRKTYGPAAWELPAAQLACP